MERSDLTALKQYYTNAAQQVPGDSHYMQTLNHKFGHSQKVLQQGRQILLHTPELQSKDETFRNLAQKALLFHDVGRFEETVRRYKSAQNGVAIAAMSDEYEHCAIGYELLKNQPEYNDMRILFAVRWHGRTMEEVRASAMYQQIKNLPQFEEIMQILYLVRDADKLANLYAAKEQDRLRHDLFYQLIPAEILTAPLSDKVKEQFFSEKIVLSATLTSFADRILQILSWIYDFNYQTSIEIFKEQQYGEFLLDMLAQYHHNPQDLQQIRAKVDACF